MPRRGLWFASLLCVGGLMACVSNHEALEKKPANRGAGAGGGGASSAGAPNHRGGSGGELAMGGGHPDDEPPGDSLLTIVNGVVDAPRIALCASKLDADGNTTAVGSPLTDAPLEYGQSVVLRELDDVDFDADRLQLLVIAGELDRIAGLDCEAAIALARVEEGQSEGPNPDLGQGGAAGDTGESGVPVSAGSGGEGSAELPEAAGSGGAPPASGARRAALRVRGLPVIPERTLNAGRSWVLVANGCLGGATYSGEDAVQYCGEGYTPREPTVSAVLVSLSRHTAEDYVALQVVHASLANAAVEIYSRPPLPSMSSGIGITSVVLGQVAPRPAWTLSNVHDLGSARKYAITVEARGEALWRQPWASALALGGLSELTDGKGYALILSGPRGDMEAVPDLWNAATVTAIAVDPE